MFEELFYTWAGTLYCKRLTHEYCDDIDEIVNSQRLT